MQQVLLPLPGIQRRPALQRRHVVLPGVPRVLRPASAGEGSLGGEHIAQHGDEVVGAARHHHDVPGGVGVAAAAGEEHPARRVEPRAGGVQAW